MKNNIVGILFNGRTENRLQVCWFPSILPGQRGKKCKFTTCFLKVSRNEQSRLFRLYSPTGPLITSRESLARNSSDTCSVSLGAFAAEEQQLLCAYS